MKTLALLTAFTSLLACTEKNPRLDVEVRGEGKVTSNPPGIDCPTACSAEFAKGTPVALTAKGPEGGTVRFEIGELPPSSDTHRVLTLNDDMRVTVTLTPNVPLNPPPVAPSPYPTPGRGDPGLPRVQPGPGYIDGGPSPESPQDKPTTPPPPPLSPG